MVEDIRSFEIGTSEMIPTIRHLRNSSAAGHSAEGRGVASSRRGDEQVAE
jgi:hypothetical protein